MTSVIMVNKTRKVGRRASFSCLEKPQHFWLIKLKKRSYLYQNKFSKQTLTEYQKYDIIFSYIYIFKYFKKRIDLQLHNEAFVEDLQTVKLLIPFLLFVILFFILQEAVKHEDSTQEIKSLSRHSPVLRGFNKRQLS